MSVDVTMDKHATRQLLTTMLSVARCNMKGGPPGGSNMRLPAGTMLDYLNNRHQPKQPERNRWVSCKRGAQQA
jgi:hypothetical protein